MCTPKAGGHRRAQSAVFAAAVAALGTFPSFSHGQVNLTKNSNTNWTITDGAITAVFDPARGYYLDQLEWQFESAGRQHPGIGRGVGGHAVRKRAADIQFADRPEQQLRGCLDKCRLHRHQRQSDHLCLSLCPVRQRSDGLLLRSAEPLGDRSEHGDQWFGRHVGPAWDRASFCFDRTQARFPISIRSTRAKPTRCRQCTTTIGIPSTNPNFATVTAAAGRTVQNVTYDLTGSGIAGDNGTNFFTKYDYSVYTQFYPGRNDVRQ